jgi:LPS export ABC transporter protein LptC
MSRAQLRFAVGTTIVLLLSAVGYHLVANLYAQRQRQAVIARLAPDLDPETAQRMQNFRRVKVRNGKKVWEIAARQARYFSESGEVVVDDPEVSLYLSDGKTIALRCREGRVQLDAGAQEITTLQLSGDLKIQFGEVSLSTQQAIYDSAANVISSPGSLQLVGPGFTVHGQGYTIEVAQKRLILHAAVHTTLTTGEGQ